MRVRVKGLKRYKDRHGKMRLYHRASGKAIDPELPGELIAMEVARLNALYQPKAARPGSLGGLFASYRNSPRFTKLAPRTKDGYHRIMAELEPLDDMPLIEFTGGFAARLRDKMLVKRKAGFTNHMLAVLSSAFKHGLEYDLVSANPMRGIQKAHMDKSRRKPNRPWTHEERNNVLAVAPTHLRLPLALAAFLGLRRSDIIKVSRSAYKNGLLTWKTSKTGRYMSLPVVGGLKQIIDGSPRGDSTLLCVNSRGKNWTADGFASSMGKFLKQCMQRGLASEGITLHGLRHSVATNLKESGWGNEQIKDFLGHDTLQMTEHYSSTADVNDRLIDMANVLQRRSKREQKLSNL